MWKWWVSIQCVILVPICNKNMKWYMDPEGCLHLRYHWNWLRYLDYYLDYLLESINS